MRVLIDWIVVVGSLMDWDVEETDETTEVGSELLDDSKVEVTYFVWS